MLFSGAAMDGDDGRRERRESHIAIAPSSATEKNIHTATPSAARYDSNTQTKEYNTEKTYEIIARWLMDCIIMSLWCLWCVKCIYCSHHTSHMHLLLLLLLKMQRRYCWDLFGNYMFSHMVWSMHILASVVSSCRHRRCRSFAEQMHRVKCAIGHALQVWSIYVVCVCCVYS